VILDVVYNHFGPSDLDLWRFDGWFQDSVPLDWHKLEEFSSLARMYRDLIHLRLNLFGSTHGLTGSGLNTFHQNQSDNLIAYHRWHHGGPGDDVVDVVNLSHHAHVNYRLEFPARGTWRLRLNTDWIGSSCGFGNQRPARMLSPERQAPGQNGMISRPRESLPSDRTACWSSRKINPNSKMPARSQRLRSCSTLMRFQDVPTGPGKQVV
jgi:hypothetical protein